MLEPKVQVVKCIIEDTKGRFLLIKRADSDSHAGMWETPGGGIDEGENTLQAGHREVTEETGIVSSHLIFDGRIELSDDESGEVMEVFLMSTEEPMENPVLDLSDNPDHSDGLWLCYSDLQEF